MTDKELINGIANGTIGKLDIIEIIDKYNITTQYIRALLVVAQNNPSELPIVSFDKDGMCAPHERGIYQEPNSDKWYFTIDGVIQYPDNFNLAMCWLDEIDTEMQEREQNPQPSAPRGRPSPKNFRDVINGDEIRKNEIISFLHDLIDNKQPKDVRIVILAAMAAGLISRPTYNQVKGEFANCGHISGYKRMIVTNPTKQKEIERNYANEITPLVQILRGI